MKPKSEIEIIEQKLRAKYCECIAGSGKLCDFHLFWEELISRLEGEKAS